MTHTKLIAVLHRAPIGTLAYDCDGDEWVKRNTSTDSTDSTWKRTGGGWASSRELARHGPFTIPAAAADNAIAELEERIAKLERAVVLLSSLTGIDPVTLPSTPVSTVAAS